MFVQIIKQIIACKWQKKLSLQQLVAGILSIGILLQLFPFSYHLSKAADNLTIAHTIAIAGIEYDANDSLSAPTVISGTSISYYIDAINHSATFSASTFKVKDTLPGTGLSGSLDCKFIIASASTTHTTLNFDSDGTSCTLAGGLLGGSGIGSTLAANTGIFFRIQGYTATASNFNTGLVQGIVNGVSFNITDYSYVNVAQGTLTGHVFYDDGTGGGTAGDGVQNGSEADAASMLMVADNGTMTFNGTTDSSGNYSIIVAPGTYSVTVSPSNGYTVTTNNPTTGLVVTDSSTTSAGNDGLYNGADLSLSMLVDNSTPVSGESVTYTITVTNNGPHTATSITVHNNVPASLTVFTAVTTQGIYSSLTNDWIIGTLVSGGSVSLSLTTITSGTSVISNSAEITTVSQSDPDSTPNNGIISEDDYDSIDISPTAAPSSDPNTISGLVFHDENDNATNDSEDGMSGLTITLHDVTADADYTTTTTSTGAYLFSDSNATLTVGHTYTIRSDVPSGYTESTSLIGDSFVLVSGSNTFADIGLYDPASISGKVFYDTSLTGIQDGSEPGVAGVTVTLHTSTGSLLQTKLTDGNGHYNFAQLVHNDYYIQFSNLPDSYRFGLTHQGSDTDSDSDADESGQTTLLHATDTTVVITHIDAAVSFEPANVGDRFFLDENHNGLQDGSESAGLSATVALYNANDDTLLATTTSTSDGTYAFNNINNTICLGTNTAWTSGSSQDFSCSGITAGGKYILNFTTDTFCTADQNSIRLTSATGAILYSDSCDTGTLEDNTHYQIVADETGDGTATLQLTDTFGNGGIYNITWQYSNAYLQFSLPDSIYSFSPEDIIGTDTTDSDVDSSGKTANFAVLPGDTDSTIDAGAYIIDSSISGLIFSDANNNNIHDLGDDFIHDLDVKLFSSTGALLQSTTTDSSGEYSFSNLAPGSYQIRFASITGYIFCDQHTGDTTTDSDPDTSSGYSDVIEITGNQTITHIDAGYRLNMNSIGDFVFNDSNHDGVQDSDESGIADVVVELYQGDNPTPVLTTTTDSDGAYAMTDIAYGTYHLHFSLPTNYTFSPPHTTENSTDSDPNGDTGDTDAFILSGGEHLTNIDAGMYEIDTIAPTPSADLSISTATISTTPPWLQSTHVYRVTITNNGPNTASGVVVTDLLPEGMTYIGAVTSSGSYLASDGTWNLDDMAADTSATLDITATINSTSDITMAAEITATDTDDPDSTPDNHATNEDDYAIITITPLLPEIHVQKWVLAEGSNPSGESSDSENGPIVGVQAPITYYIDINNTSSGAALTGLAVTDDFPVVLGSADWTCTFSTSDLVTLHDHSVAYDQPCSVATILANLPTTLAPESSMHIRLTQRTIPTTAADTICNKVTATADWDISATSTACLQIATPTIHITKTATPTNPKPGEPVIYTLELTNHSAYTAYNVTVSDDLDDTDHNTNIIPACISDLEHITVFNDGAITTDTNTVHWLINEIPTATTINVSFQGLIRDDLDQSTTCRNTVIAIGDNVSTVSSTATIRVPVVVNEAVIDFNQHLANHANDIFMPGDTLHYQIDISNHGTEDLNDLSTLATLPQSLSHLHDISVPTGANLDSIISSSDSTLHSATNYENSVNVSNLDMTSGSNKTIQYFADITDSSHFPLRQYRLQQHASKEDGDFYPEHIRSSSVVNDQNSENALHAPDNQNVTLGSGGEITFEVSRNSTTGKVLVDGEGPDFCILEQDTNDSDATTEKYMVEVAQSANTRNFERIGRSSGNSNCFDLADADLNWARYIRIKDISPTASTGVDIDTVCLLQIGGFVSNTAVLYNGDTSIGTSTTDVLVNFTDAFDTPLRPRDCRSTSIPVTVVSTELPPPPADLPVPTTIITTPFIQLPKTGTEGSLIVSSLLSVIWWVRRKK